MKSVYLNQFQLEIAPQTFEQKFCLIKANASSTQPAYYTSNMLVAIFPEEKPYSVVFSKELFFLGEARNKEKYCQDLVRSSFDVENVSVEDLPKNLVLKLLWNALVHPVFDGKPKWVATKFLYTDTRKDWFLKPHTWDKKQFLLLRVFEIKLSKEGVFNLHHHTFTEVNQHTQEELQKDHRYLSLYRLYTDIDQGSLLIPYTIPAEESLIPSQVFAQALLTPYAELPVPPILNFTVQAKKSRTEVHQETRSYILEYLIKQFKTRYSSYGVSFSFTPLEKSLYYQNSFETKIDSNACHYTRLYTLFLKSLKEVLSKEKLSFLFPNWSDIDAEDRYYDWKKGMEAVFQKIGFSLPIQYATRFQQDSLHLVFLQDESSVYEKKDYQKFITQHVLDTVKNRERKTVTGKHQDSNPILENCLIELAIKKDIKEKKMFLFDRYLLNEAFPIPIPKDLQSMDVFQVFSDMKQKIRILHFSLSFSDFSFQIALYPDLDHVPDLYFDDFEENGIDLTEEPFDGYYLRCCFSHQSICAIVQKTMLLALSDLNSFVSHQKQVDAGDIASGKDVRTRINVQLIEPYIDLHAFQGRDEKGQPCVLYSSGLIANGMQSKVQNFCRIWKIISLDAESVWHCLHPFLFCNAITTKDRFSSSPVFLKYIEEYKQLEGLLQRPNYDIYKKARKKGNHL